MESHFLFASATFHDGIVWHNRCVFKCNFRCAVLFWLTCGGWTLASPHKHFMHEIRWWQQLMMADDLSAHSLSIYIKWIHLLAGINQSILFFCFSARPALSAVRLTYALITHSRCFRLHRGWKESTPRRRHLHPGEGGLTTQQRARVSPLSSHHAWGFVQDYLLTFFLVTFSHDMTSISSILIWCY